MKMIGLRELRLKTKEYRSALGRHEDVLILDRGRPIAILKALKEGEVELKPVFKKKRYRRVHTRQRRIAVGQRRAINGHPRYRRRRKELLKAA